MMIMSEVASSVDAVGGRCCAMYAIRLMTWIGIGLTRRAGGSSFFQAATIRWMRKSIFPSVLYRGSVAPTVRNVCATART